MKGERQSVLFVTLWTFDFTDFINFFFFMFAIVLERKNFRENDQIVTVYTRENGKMDLLARGVKKITSKNSAFLEPFSFIDVEIVFGKDFKKIGSVNCIKSFSFAKSHLQNILLAQKTIKIFSSFIREGAADKNLFLFLFSWLNFLDNYEINKNQINLFNSFLIKFLAFLGFLPQINFCVHCSKKCTNDKENYFFDIAEGGILCSNCKRDEITYFIFSKIDKIYLNFLLKNKFENIFVNDSFSFSLVKKNNDTLLLFLDNFVGQDIKNAKLVFDKKYDL